MARKKSKRPAKKKASKTAKSRKKKSARKKSGTTRATSSSPAPKRPRGRPRKNPPGHVEPDKPRCEGTRVDGQRCTAVAIVQGYCGRHRDQIDKPKTWAESSVDEIERRKQFALMRRRELEVAEKEGTLVDTSLATMETLRIANMIQDRLGTLPARRSHELAAKLGVKVGEVSAALEVILREELTDIAESL